MVRKALIVVLMVLGCGSDTPANVAGTYTLSIAVQQNDCGILTNSVGDTSSGVEIVVTQTGSEASAKVKGVGGALLIAAMGTDTFTGKISGNSLDMSIDGTMAGSSGTCAYMRNAHLVANLSGDVLTGNVYYSFSTNKAADCGTRDTCQDIQKFNGTRPPTVGP
jgi:hypothetical protein